MFASVCNRALHLVSLATIVILFRLLASAPVTIAGPLPTTPPCPASSPSTLMPAVSAASCASYVEAAEETASVAQARCRRQVEDLERRLASLRQVAVRKAEPAPPNLFLQPQSPNGSRSRRGGGGRRLAVTATKVMLIGSDAFVTGIVRNSDDRDADVEVVVELLRNQRVENRGRLRLLIPARSSAPFSHTFPTGLEDGTYAARARVAR